jgi:hypothetical protein
MSKVQGGELMLFLNGKSIAFATNHELNIDTDTSDFSCKDEGDCGWSNEEIDMLNWSVTSDNVFALGGEGNTYEDLFDLMLERTPIDAVFNKKNEDGCNVPTGGWTSSDDKPYKGKVIITDLSLTAQHGEYATFSASFMGYGELVDTSKIKYLWFEPLDKAARFKFTKNQPNDVDIEYSLDGENWTFLPSGEASPNIKVGQKIYWRGELGVQTYHWSDDEILLTDCGIGTFAVTEFGTNESPAKFKVGGDVNSLLTYDFYKLHDLTPYRYAFLNLFKQSSVFDITEMIFRNIKLSYYCYGLMFNTCLSLTYLMDELPAMQLANHCYYSMFNGCTAITKAPELPATELADLCYHWMFNNCRSLTEAPRLVAPNINQRSCYLKMFENCRNLNRIYLDAINIDSELIHHTNNNPFIDWMNNIAVCGVLVIKPYNTWYNQYTLTDMYISENWVVTTNENSVDNYNVKLFDKDNNEIDEIWYSNGQTIDEQSERPNAPISIKGYKYDSQLFRGSMKVVSTYLHEYSIMNPNYHQGGVIGKDYDEILDGQPYTQPIASATFDLSKFDQNYDDKIYAIILDENSKPLAYKKFRVAFLPL